MTLVSEHRSQVALEQLWETLDASQRQEALLTLGWIVARQIQEPHGRKRMRHEDC